MDDLSWSLYAPIDRDSMMENAVKLEETCEGVLKYVEDHCCLAKKEDFAQWGVFLRKTLNHNLTKLKEVDCQEKLSDVKIT